jgi:hypothetical protein
VADVVGVLLGEPVVSRLDAWSPDPAHADTVIASRSTKVVDTRRFRTSTTMSSLT